MGEISVYPQAAPDYPWAAPDFCRGQHANCSFVMLQQTMGNKVSGASVPATISPYSTRTLAAAIDSSMANRHNRVKA